MGRKIVTFFTILVASLAIAHQLGITLPSPETGLNRTSLSIFLGQFLICYFSRLPARAIVSPPSRLKGDIDGSLTAELRDDHTSHIQAVICSTVTIASGALVIAKLCCPDGVWIKAPEPVQPLLIFTAVSEFIFASCSALCESSKILNEPIVVHHAETLVARPSRFHRRWADVDEKTSSSESSSRSG
jgi:hypothetical protein